MRASLPPGPPLSLRPVLVVVSGLPGTGKSFFSRRLVEQVPVLVLESDTLRRVLFARPTYSAAESARLFTACHQLMAELLEDGVPVLFDATNLTEGHREELYHIAEQHDAKLLLVQIKASPEVVYRRLQDRAQALDPEDNSTADWLVYKRMRPTMESIHRNHFVVDTSRDIGSAIDKVTRQIKRRMR